MYLQCVCVFRVDSDDRIQRNVRWLACDSCLSLLCIWLNSNYRSTVQVGLLNVILRWGQWWVCKWTGIYISRFQHNVDRNERVFDGTSYCMKPEKMWNKRSRWSSTWNEYTVGYRLILISLPVPLCNVLSDCLSLLGIVFKMYVWNCF